MYASLAGGYVTKLNKVKTFADGIAVKEVGNLTYDYTNKHVDDILIVKEEEILDAIKKMMVKEKIVSEGAGATPLAAVLNNYVPDIEGKNVVCILSGGNIDVTILSKVIERGLMKAGRSDLLAIQLEDRPGQLQGVSSIIASLGGNVVSVFYEKASEGSNITDCVLRINLETRNFEHIQQIRSALIEKGFNVIN